MIHLYWPDQNASICTLELRESPLSQASPAHVPMVIHHADICPMCLRGAEIGPTDKGGNRVRPAIVGVAVP